MRYIISDIHGCYDDYRALLEKINFSDSDELYILGDVVDRGPEPIKVLLDMMVRPKVFFVLGNHDFLFYFVMKKLSVEVTEENCESYLKPEDIEDYQLWLADGGDTTATQFRNLSLAQREDILAYIEEAELYEEIINDGKRYVLTHAGISNFSPDKELWEYDMADFLEGRADYGKRYFPDENTYLVTGHTPTTLINENKEFSVYKGNGHIAIDCGCVFGGRLAAYCIETDEVTYSN